MNMAAPILFCLVVVVGTQIILWQRQREWQSRERMQVDVIIGLLDQLDKLYKQIEDLKDKKP